MRYLEVPLKTTRTQHVVILVIDGPRYSETYGDSAMQYIPFLRDSLMPHGTFYSNFFNNGVTLTVSGHATLTCGKYQNLNNSGLELPKFPGIFHYYLQQYPEDTLRTWIVGSKGKLEVLAGFRRDWSDTILQPKVHCGIDGKGVGYAKDYLTMQKVKSVLKSHSPKLMLINLLDVDVAGHAHNWDGYIRGIQTTDSCAWQIWQWIQSNPEMKDQTTLLITNDHGRHLDGRKNGFVSHGDLCYGCRKISLLALGPDCPKGKVVSARHSLIDIAPTVAEMLQFRMQRTPGDLLKDVVAGNKKME